MAHEGGVTLTARFSGIAFLAFGILVVGAAPRFPQTSQSRLHKMQPRVLLGGPHVQPCDALTVEKGALSWNRASQFALPLTSNRAPWKSVGTDRKSWPADSSVIRSSYPASSEPLIPGGVSEVQPLIQQPIFPAAFHVFYCRACWRTRYARFEEVPEPSTRDGSVVVEAVAVGVCGTDVEIVEGKYGWAPPEAQRLVLGHESLGRVVDPGDGNAFQKGDLVVGIVRRPDPVPCPHCAVGEWDMCQNGQYTERGIKQINGIMSERWRIEPEYAVKVDHSLGLLTVLHWSMSPAVERCGQL